MNYLAHLYLSEANDDAWLGSLLGDFVKGPLDDRYSEAVTRAIVLHRKIDSFTDAHPLVLRSKSRVSSQRRRYAGIMMDMFYDHFLAKYWHEFHGETLARFTSRIYRTLEQHYDTLPPRLQHVAPLMTQGDWLGSYADIGSIATALNRMGQRLTRGNGLLNSVDDLVEHYAELESDFRAFFPDVLHFARSHDAMPATVNRGSPFF